LLASFGRTRRPALLLPALLLCLTTSICHSQVARRWTFDRSGDLEQWTIPANVRGSSDGGALWLAQRENPTIQDQRSFDLASSPSGLQIPATQVTQVRLRVLNLSSLTDLYVRWRTIEEGWGVDTTGFAAQFAQPAHSRRCSLQADLRAWQEITCFIDQRWQGTIDQISLGNARKTLLRGDLWIDWIEIGKGPLEPQRVRPDVASNDVVPRITLPGVSQEGFHDAFRVLDRCLIVDVPIFGFTYPVMSPGGHYHEGGWWLLDSSLTLTGAKWANPHFAEGVLRGFRDEQAANPDGRIDFSGLFMPSGQVLDQTQFPKYFEVAYDVARRTGDEALRAETYESMRKFLDWWLSPVKRDSRTGLVTGYGEETFGDLLQAGHILGEGTHIEPFTVAPVDLNVLIAVAAARTAELARVLRKPEEESLYRETFVNLSRAINSYLWDESQGAYYNYDLRDEKLHAGLNVATFDPLRLRIAPPTRRDRLLKRLLDPKQFNWGRRPLTSWAMNQDGFVMEAGDTDPRAWFGGIWIPRNMMVVDGLEDSGRPDLAAELNWSTIKTFHSNYREFVHASTGAGHGAEGYGLTASQYIGAIIEHLFGVDYDRIQKRLRITPHIPKALYGQDLALENLILPTGGDTRLSVRVRQSTAETARIEARISGDLPEGNIYVALPGGTKEVNIPVGAIVTAEFP